MTQSEKILREVDSSMAMEGMPLTHDDKLRIRRCLEDPSLLEETLQELIRKHTVKEAGHERQS